MSCINHKRNTEHLTYFPTWKYNQTKQNFLVASPKNRTKNDKVIQLKLYYTFHKIQLIIFFSLNCFKWSKYSVIYFSLISQIWWNQINLAKHSAVHNAKAQYEIFRIPVFQTGDEINDLFNTRYIY